VLRPTDDVFGPGDEALNRRTPWALELANGARCTFATGATATTAGLRLNYFCEEGGAAYGEPVRGKHPWTIPFASDRGTEPHDVAVKSAWY